MKDDRKIVSETGENIESHMHTRIMLYVVTSHARHWSITDMSGSGTTTT